MPVLKGGQALKQAIHVARARTDITSDSELSRRAHVSYDTFMNWFGDRTMPRPFEVKKVADVLGIPYGDLMAAWEGREAEPPALQDAIRELVAELRLSRVQQHEATIAMLQALGSLVPPGRARPGTRAGSGRAARAGSDRS